MYYRVSNSGNRVEWNPTNESAASQALIETSGTGVSTADDVSAKSPVELDKETARQVNERYKTLTLKKLVVQPEDGQIEANGAGSETLAIEVVNGDDERVTENYTANLAIDNTLTEVSVIDGVGTTDITTDKTAGAQVNVQAVDLDETEAVSSKAVGLDVV
ncbi:hypothetical protein HRTV-2_gp38 [Halorubrum virus HRTV-2]|nr:hypothetical protein HRTV-2_gp38 [Halorubrum virus HRTV-2]